MTGIYNAEYSKKYYNQYQDKLKVYAKNYRIKLKKKIYEVLGNKCNCCGESNEKFLQIDHVNNDGAADRLNFSNKKAYSSKKFYCWIIKQGIPKDRYQLLCANCNYGKARNGGICPHKMK